MKLLLSIPEHTDYLDNNFFGNTIKWKLHKKRVEFGRQIMEKWMFVPSKFVKDVWVVLEEPDHLKFKSKNQFNELDWQSELSKNQYHELYDEYRKAKDRVLFEGFTYHIGLDNNNSDFWFVRNSSRKIHDYEFEVQCLSIEMMVNQNYILALTETGEKQLSP